MISPLQWQHGPKREVSSTRICSSSSGDFMKSHSISPDGSQVLISSESNYLACWNLGDLPLRTQYYNSSTQNYASAENVGPNMSHVFNMGESIYDFAWHPYVDPITNQCCYFIATTKDHPLHMMDMNTGVYFYCSIHISLSKRENKMQLYWT